MSYTDGRGFTDSLDNQKDFNEKYIDKDPGPYIGVVKTTVDPLRMGRLGVNIADLTKTDDPDPSQITWCQYLSPFYGVKSIDATQNNDAADFKTTQQSYGMWFVPPDIGTSVLVIFVKGERKQSNAFWIGCIQDPLTNQMVPGHGASTFTENNSERISGRERGITQNAGVKGFDNYGTDLLPVGEKNRKLVAGAQTVSAANSFRYPVNDLLADQLKEQGLIQDNIRGTTTSSARRETPSQVFGMSTPGRFRPDSRSVPIGVNKQNVLVDRRNGHSFVMDDGDVNGNNQLTRLRTASGHQLLMHDTQGVVYIANASGKSWLEMSAEGKIYIYAQDGFNLRADGNFDLHSGGDINFHAKNDIKFNAEKNVSLSGEEYLMMMGQKGVFTSSQGGSVRHFARDGITSFTNGQQLHGAGGAVHLSGAQVHFNSTGASSSWGPTWLEPKAVGIITDNTENDVNIVVGPNQVLEANTAKNKTTVPQLVTHEPFTRPPSGITEGVSQWQNDAEWKKLSSTPGTLEYMAQKNRTSDNEYVRKLQFFADQKKYLDDFRKKPIVTFKSSSVALDDFKKLTDKIQSKNANLSTKELSLLRNAGVYDAREAVRLGQSVTENVNANASVIASKMKRIVKDFNVGDELGTYKGGKVDIALDQAKILSDNFTKGYNAIYKVNTVVENLSTDSIKQVLVQNVVAGNVTSVVSKLTNNFFNKSGSGVPDAIRGNVIGNRFTQIASSFKTGITKAFSSIGSIFSDSRLKEEIRYVGKSPMGINIYSFKYKQLPGRYIGVMAQEVPWARKMTDIGFYAVDYSKLDVEFRRLQ